MKVKEGERGSFKRSEEDEDTRKGGSFVKIGGELGRLVNYN